jgi:hypothetical protein
MKLHPHVYRTVTQGDWGVSCTTGTGIKGAILNVSRSRIAGVSLPVSKWFRGFGDGRLFDSTESAYQFAYDHGYIQLYYTAPGLRQARKDRATRMRA